MNTVLVEVCPACTSKSLQPFLNVADHRASKETFSLVRCGKCGFVLTQSHPAEAEIGRYYETDDYISHSDNGTSLLDKVYYVIRRRMAQKKERLLNRFAKGKRLIDIGAGTGFFVAYMQMRGWDVKGLEPSSQARAVAKQSHDIILNEPSQLFQFSNDSADAITLWHVLEHVHAPLEYLNAIHHTLNAHGVLFLALPNHTSPDAKYYGKWWGAWDVPRHLWHFSPESVERIASRNGFKLMGKRTLPFDPFYVALMSERYKGGGMLRALRGLIIGTLSWFLSLFRKNSASSIIYILSKS